MRARQVRLSLKIFATQPFFQWSFIAEFWLFIGERDRSEDVAKLKEVLLDFGK